MKKTLTLFLFCSLALYFAGCNQNPAAISNIPNSQTQKINNLLTSQAETAQFQTNTVSTENESQQTQIQANSERQNDDEEPLNNSIPEKIKAEKITQKNKEQNYTIEVNYPQFITSEKTTVQKKINADIKNMIMTKIKHFKASAEDGNKEWSPEDVEGSVGNSFMINYAIFLLNDNILSIRFYFSEYYIGQPHANFYSTVANYDLATSHEIHYTDFFKKNANYLKIISDESIPDLQKNLQDEGIKLSSDQLQSIQEGAGPQEENYTNFNLGPQELIIYFDVYQVTSYADGPQEVHIPYSKIKESLDPKGILEKMVTF